MAFTEALTRSNGLSLAVKPHKVEEACQKASSVSASVRDPRGLVGSAAPFPKDAGWEPDPGPPLRLVWCSCAVQNCTQHLLGAKMTCLTIMGEKIVRRSVSTRLVKYFPVERSVHIFLPGTLAMPRMRHGISTFSRAEKYKYSKQTEPASLITSKGNCTYQHNLLGSKS